jgi:phosphotransferase system IIB component
LQSKQNTMQLYKIKLDVGGYLTMDKALNVGGSEDTLCLYGRGEAIKKARAFKGRIEKHGKNHCITELRTAMLDTREINNVILNDMKGREAFVDNTDNNEVIYNGDIFDTILGEQSELPKDQQFSVEVLDELNQLSVLMYEYSYIHLVKYI